MMTSKQYIERGGCECPFCESTNINAFDEYDGECDGAWRSIECHDCGNAWRDLYTLSGFEQIEGE